ncbi:MAG: translation initiation factor IF-3 [Chloroflexota bacterium]
MCDEEVIEDIIKELRVNERIHARQVRLVGDKGEQLGIMPIAQAQETARKQNLDLVEVAPTADPPVCRLLDYGKYKYAQAKKEQEAKKSQKTSELRQVRMRPKIGKHDFDAKARTVRKLLSDRDKVKVTILFRGREITHPELGWKLLQKVAGEVDDISVMERQPSMEGRQMHIILAPTNAPKPKAKEEEAEETVAAVKETENAEVKNA